MRPLSPTTSRYLRRRRLPALKRAGLVIALSLGLFIAQVAMVLYFHQSIANTLASWMAVREEKRPEKGWNWGLLAARKIERSNQDDRNVRLYILGGSTGEKFFAHNELIDRLPGISIWDITAPRQNMYERLMLVDAIRRQAVPGLVVLTIHPISLSYDNVPAVVKSRYFNGANYRYGIDSPLAERFYQSRSWDFQPPVIWRFMQSANVLLSMASQFITQYTVVGRGTLKDLVVGDAPAPEPKANEANKDRDVNEQIKYRMRSFSDQGVDLALDLLDPLARACQERNLRLVIFELPYGDIYRANAAPAVDIFHQRMLRFVAGHANTGLYSIARSLYGGRECLFFDSVHTTPQGSRFFACPFMELLFDKILPDAGLPAPVGLSPDGRWTCPDQRLDCD